MSLIVQQVLGIFVADMIVLLGGYALGFRITRKRKQQEG